ncbi:MAG: ATPase, T2SS/T4P/T4SS family [Thermofilaceae archaeon]
MSWLVQSVRPKRSYRIASSKLFLSTDPVPFDTKDFVVVDYYGLRSEVHIGDGMIYVRDVYNWPSREIKGKLYIEKIDDKTIQKALNKAEAALAREGADPVEEAEKTVELLRRALPRRFADLAPAVYRYFYDYGSLVPIFMAADKFGITDVLVPDSTSYVEVESYKHGMLHTTIELTEADRQFIQERVSVRVAPLSSWNPGVSKYDRWHGIRVTAVVPDIARRPSFAFRVVKTWWTPPRIVALRGATPWEVAYLGVHWRRNGHVLVAGEPGSGKTTLLEAVIHFTRPEDNLALVQSIPELKAPQAKYYLVERVAYGAGIRDLPMWELVQKLGLRLNAKVAINELVTREDMYAYLTVAFAGFAAGATIHSDTPEKAVQRLLDLGATESHLKALLPQLALVFMEKFKTPRGTVRRVRDIFRWQDGKFRKVTEEEALKDPEVARWAEVVEDAARSGATEPEAWVAILRQV